ncbi:MAG: hypothetical protein LUQ13_03050 [Methanomicrobiales archaeon]|nr:hypothetical protein [Methanomicrobiales archaeon]
MIRHITGSRNVREGLVLDPRWIKHGVITAGKISDLSGWADPATHFNLDFPAPPVDRVVVAETLAIGGRISTGNGRFVFAGVDPRSYQHLGPVDLAARSRSIRALGRPHRGGARDGV